MIIQGTVYTIKSKQVISVKGSHNSAECFMAIWSQITHTGTVTLQIKTFKCLFYILMKYKQVWIHVWVYRWAQAHPD